MSAQAFELLSAAARYWFTGLAMAILALATIAVYRSARSDIRHAGEERPLLTLFLISEADRTLEADFSVTVCEDGMVGRSRLCDARIRHKGVARRHAAFNTSRKDDMMIIPMRNAFVAVNGQQTAKPAVIAPGDKIQLGPLVFRVQTGGAQL